MALRALLRGGVLAVARPQGLRRTPEHRSAHGGPAPQPPASFPLLGALKLLLSALPANDRRDLALSLHPPPPPPLLRAPEVRTVEVIRRVVETREVPAPPPPEHPVLGRLLHDFGYKRVYAMRAATLADAQHVPVWNMQRSFRPERAEAIARAKRSDASLGLPGVVTLYEVAGGGAFPFRCIIDGQHRVGALRLLLRDLAASMAASSPWERVLVEVFPLQNEAAAEALFVEVNSAQPVLLVDLPAAHGGAAADVKGALEAASATLAARFPAMFKPSTACKPPHVNIDALRDRLHAADALAVHGLGDGGALLDWLLARNEALGQQSDAQWQARRPARKSAAADATFAKALAKAREHRFFLGMDWRWLEE